MNRATPRSFNDLDTLTVPMTATERELLDQFRRVRTNHHAACVDGEGRIECVCPTGNSESF